MQLRVNGGIGCFGVVLLNISNVENEVFSVRCSSVSCVGVNKVNATQQL